LGKSESGFLRAGRFPVFGGCFENRHIYFQRTTVSCEFGEMAVESTTSPEKTIKAPATAIAQPL